jgi:hypothetical protein
VSGRELRQASLHVVEGHSLVIPLIVDRLPETIECLGRRWLRKREFHLTVVAERLLKRASTAQWDAVVRVASGRVLGPVRLGDEMRRVNHPDRPELETLAVMAECPGLEGLIDDLSAATGIFLPVPPAHVTLYSTDPAQGIGIVDQRELAERAPPLSSAEQAAVREAIGQVSR